MDGHSSTNDCISIIVLVIVSLCRLCSWSQAWESYRSFSLSLSHGMVSTFLDSRLVEMSALSCLNPLI